MGMHRPTYIYVLFDERCPDNIRYVGKTVDINKRISSHKHAAFVKNNSSYLYRWIRKVHSSGSTFGFYILETVFDQSMWALVERFWIKYYRDHGHRLTNLTDGGEGMLGHKATKETLNKMREVRLGKKIHTEESKKRIKEGNTNKKVSDETKLKISASNLRKEKLGRNNLGIKYVFRDRNKFKVSIGFCCKNHHIGTFSTIEEAKEVSEEISKHRLDNNGLLKENFLLELKQKYKKIKESSTGHKNVYKLRNTYLYKIVIKGEIYSCKPVSSVEEAIKLLENLINELRSDKS